MWFIHDDKNYQAAESLHICDKFLAVTILRLFPRSVKPNHLTIFRLLMSPVVVIAVFFGHYQFGLVFFLVVATTDALDGAMARTKNEITNWGKIYDPLADKLLIGGMVFAIVLRYIDFWAAMTIIVLEIIIITSAWWRKHQGMPVQANVWGKIKMILQVAGTVFLLLAVVFNLESLLPFGAGAFYLGIAFAVVSLLTYGI